MEMTSFPVEIQCEIIESLEAPFFRQDVRRLTVSRTWYRFALPVLMRCLDLDANLLHRFAEGARQYTIKSAMAHTAEISIWLQESPALDWLCLNDQLWHPRTVPSLKKDFISISRVLNRFTKLRRVSFTALPVGKPRRDYLPCYATITCVCSANITSMDLDFGGSGLAETN